MSQKRDEEKKERTPLNRKTKKSFEKQGDLPIPEFQKLWETNGVFSDHYIRTKLERSKSWPEEAEVKPIWEFCAELWEKRKLGLAKGNEALTRQELIDKVLKKLGFSFLPNTRLPVGKRALEPDYILYTNEETKDKVFEKDKSVQYEYAITILEAKKVNHPLDAVSRRETPGRFPHQQLRDYLQAATDPSGKPYFRWAILTNGNRWRLYNRDAHPSSYFELNFEIAITSLEQFMFFVTLFSPKVFIKDSEGLCILDDLYSESLEHQTELEKDLRKRIFNILERLANGFAKHPENKIGVDDLDKVYENCLVFLYRLLFILYAEGRGLLPVKPSGIGSNKYYRERYSLQSLLAELRFAARYTSDEFTELYEKLLKLFHLINGDKPSRNKLCNVPPYNGGLFDHKKHPLLERWRVGEQILADVLRGLMFGKVPVGIGEQDTFEFGETIDYADLEVRQLGSIYEGLLEHHLELEGNHLKLKADKSKRKETGTYYTPDYIVRYIVERTLQPLCKEINRTKTVKQAIKKKRKDNSFAEAVLQLNVLDPAMGSGHFLVRTTELLADHILDHLTTALQIKKVPRGVSHEQAEISYWRRRIVESCIYGVDLNPLAVELAKLSLWLTCIAIDKPLSFLDHHLRVGNSLIGAGIEDLRSLSSQKKRKVKGTEAELFLDISDVTKDLQDAVEEFQLIESKPTDTIKAIKNKRSIHDKLRKEHLDKWQEIADIWTSSFFGIELQPNIYKALSDYILGKDKRIPEKWVKGYLSKAIEVAQNRHFFHWELEFPEVFFNEDGTPKANPGFDAVMGNPPYGAELDTFERLYIAFHYPFSRSNKNSAMVFIERGLAEKQSNGYLGYIIPKSLAFSQKWSSGRELTLNQLESVSDVSKAFEKVLLEQIVIVLSDKFATKRQYKTSLFKGDEEFKSSSVSKLISRVKDTLILGANKEELKIFEKVSESKFFLNFGDISKSSRGLPFQKYIKTDSGIDSIAIYRGDHIARYSLKESNEFISKNVLKNARDKVPFLSQPKVISQNIVAHVEYPTDHIILMATFDQQGILTLDTVENTVVTNKNFSLGFITSLLNSNFFSWYAYRFIFAKALRTMHLEDYHIGKLPIRRIFFTTSKTTRKKMVEKMKTMDENFKYNEVLNNVEECLPKDKKGNFITNKEKSDVVHDLLAYLAEHMITMNKKKQMLSSKFLTWLESEIIKGSINDLKNKTKVREFYKYGLEELISVLKQNSILPKILDLGDRRYETLKNAYDSTMSKLKPLMNKLAATDTLIDQIIYKLYGLTEGEIKVVEGS